VDGAQVGVLKQANQIGLAGLLQGSNGSALEAQVSLEILGDLPDQTLEGQLPDEQLSGLLVTTDLTQSTVPGLYLWGFFTPPVEGALFLAALVASCFLGAFPPVDLRAVCFVRAIIQPQRFSNYYAELLSCLFCR